MANGKSTPQACKEAGIHTQTYYRWRKDYGGLKVEQAKRLKVLEKENTRLKRLIAELSLEKQVLKGHCQSKIAGLSYSTEDRELGRPELTPLGKCSGAVELDVALSSQRVARRDQANISII